MLTEEKRLFVGNIPPGVTENDLRNEFNAYGSVKSVELKSKENLVDPENPSIFAFVNLEIDGNSIRQCIEEFSRETYRGRYLNVSVARESFLDRLKRERAEAGKPVEDNVPPAPEVQKSSLKKIVHKPSVQLESVQSEDDSSSSEESEDEPPATIIEKNNNEGVTDADNLFITKKRASSSLLNGKIKIQPVNSEPIHVITKKQKNVKRLDDKAQQANQKRKESLLKMKNQYNQQKLAIQKALATVDSQAPKKIVFDDDIEMINGDVEKPASKKFSLFEENDENDDDEKSYEKDFEIKNHLLSAGGEKLIKLQSRFRLDPRFQMDERFIENEVNEDATDTQKSKDEVMNDDERKWQLGIIEQVVGRKLETLSESNRRKLTKTMLRFDPLKEEHQKFLKNVQHVVAESIKEDEGDKIDEKDEPQVLKEQFYTISEDLAQSLKRRGEGFSLLSMFGRAEDDDKNNKQILNDDYQEKPILNNAIDKTLNNPFNFDSSDSEDENPEKINKLPKVMNKKEEKVKSGGKETKMGVWTENFFMFGKDERLKEGSTFFTAVKQKDNEDGEDYDQVKAKLKVIINQKIRKTKKNLKGPKAGFNKFKRKT